MKPLTYPPTWGCFSGVILHHEDTFGFRRSSDSSPEANRTSPTLWTETEKVGTTAETNSRNGSVHDLKLTFPSFVLVPSTDVFHVPAQLGKVGGQPAPYPVDV